MVIYILTITWRDSAVHLKWLRDQKKKSNNNKNIPRYITSSFPALHDNF